MSTIPALRKEANPLAWSALDHAQQKAFEKILAALNMAQNEAEITYKPDEPWERSSRILFVDGKRGTGKTALILTLKKALEKGHDWTIDPSKDALSQSVKAHLNQLSERCICLPLLDLEPLPQETNLLAALLVRIERAYREKLHGGCKDSTTYTQGWSIFERGANEANPVEEAQQQFRRLLTNVALGWDGHLSARRDKDPDTYAHELQRTEGARLELQDFDQVLAKLALVLKEKLNHYPLFVCMVDDADLNPARACELLLLFRMVAARNLIFVVGGNFRNLQALTELYYAKDIGRLLGIDNHSLIECYKQEIQNIALQTTYTTLDKLIPLNQRISLAEMTPEEAFEFSPNGTTKTVKTLLSEIELDKIFTAEHQERYVSPLKTALDFFLPELWEHDKEWPCTAYALCVPIRTVYHFWIQLFKVISDNLKSLEPLIRIAAQNFINELFEDISIPYNVKNQLKQIVRIDETGIKINNQKRVIRITSDYIKPSTNTNEYFQLYQLEPLALIIYPSEDISHKVSLSASAWGFILNDLISCQYGIEETFNFADFSFPLHGAVFSSALHDSPIPIEWWLPKWDKISDIETFRKNWNLFYNKLISNSSIKKEEWIEYISFFWIKIIFHINSGEKIEMASMFDIDWESIIDNVCSAVEQLKNKKYSGMNVSLIDFIEIFLPGLLAPECGLPKEIIGKFFDKDNENLKYLKGLWINNADNINQFRYDRFNDASKRRNGRSFPRIRTILIENYGNLLQIHSLIDEYKVSESELKIIDKTINDIEKEKKSTEIKIKILSDRVSKSLKKSTVETLSNSINGLKNQLDSINNHYIRHIRKHKEISEQITEITKSLKFLSRKVKWLHEHPVEEIDCLSINELIKLIEDNIEPVATEKTATGRMDEVIANLRNLTRYGS